MEKNSSVVRFRQPDAIDDPLTGILRSGARRLLTQAVEMEAEAFLATMKDPAYIAQAKKLLTNGGAIGRKLDFLAQELHRESNTLTAKANDLELTNIGLELKGVVEQFREQVQNLE